MASSAKSTGAQIVLVYMVKMLCCSGSLTLRATSRAIVPHSSSLSCVRRASSYSTRRSCAWSTLRVWSRRVATSRRSVMLTRRGRLRATVRGHGWPKASSSLARDSR
ncbi:hypothetical protein DMC30DRAFT_399689 [Rhodotorula diobovata]|uniref:Uncharacterized protein n=1 Tax=Rhodotorula diobovata TaxID=5288 RepID=A0A5C5FSG4_9BASI|nr:hypothetical protein DMC30DRAFT_399689 [Rhodotorula diobovata]